MSLPQIGVYFTDGILLSLHKIPSSYFGIKFVINGVMGFNEVRLAVKIAICSLPWNAAVTIGSCMRDDMNTGTDACLTANS